MFAASPKTLSLQSCFPYFLEYEKKNGSLIKGMLMDKSGMSQHVLTHTRTHTHTYTPHTHTLTHTHTRTPHTQSDSSFDPCSLLAKAKAEQWTVYSFKNGLQTLPDTLITKVMEKGVKVNLEQPCSKLTFEDGKAKVCVCVCARVCVRASSLPLPFYLFLYVWVEGCVIHVCMILFLYTWSLGGSWWQSGNI